MVQNAIGGATGWRRTCACPVCPRRLKRIAMGVEPCPRQADSPTRRAMCAESKSKEPCATSRGDLFPARRCAGRGFGGVGKGSGRPGRRLDDGPRQLEGVVADFVAVPLEQVVILALGSPEHVQ